MSMDLEHLIRRQVELQSRIARTVENLKKTGTANITVDAVENRLLRLDSSWAKFEQQHDELHAKHWEALQGHEYQRSDFAGQVEEMYLQQRTQLTMMKRSLSVTVGKTEATPSGSSSLPSARTTLPRIQLPRFSGQYEDWPSFRDLFLSIIGNDLATSDVEKLHYLKSCLEKEAALLIKNLPTIGENYGRAWSTLKGYYENKRLLVRSCFSNFSALQRMKSESASELRKLFHCVTNTVGFLESIGRPISNSEDLFVHLVAELLDSRSRREWESALSDQTEPPPYSELRTFLEQRLRILKAVQPPKSENSHVKATTETSQSTRSHHLKPQDPKRGRCSLCKAEHYLMHCEAYKKMSSQERVQHIEASCLCTNCLGHHKISDCPSKRSCGVCGERHHSTLHDAHQEAKAAKTSHVASQPPIESAAVLLATARIRMADQFGDFHTARALIDQGSETSLISEVLAQRLKLSRARTSVSIFGVSGQQAAVARGRVSLKFSSRIGGTSMTTSALILPRLTIYAGNAGVKRGKWAHLRELELADPDFLSTDPIEILLGADVHAAILRGGLRKGGPREPVGQNTAVSLAVSLAVRRFWEQEELPPTVVPLTPEEQECEDLFLRIHYRRSDGRYVVRLPVIEPLPDLSSSRRAASRVLTHVERRLECDSEMRALYVDFMRQYEGLRHMFPAEPPTGRLNSRTCYLPHHGVLRAESSSTKLRVVFNGSSTFASGGSLNEHLLPGPNLLPALADVLLRWRIHKYVLATDIEKMFRQVLVHPDDRDLQRILWRYDRADDVQDYRLNTITYGLACAPCLAIRTLRQLAEDEAGRFPLGAAVLRRDVYMDDALTGAPTLQEAKEIQRQLSQICSAVGFPLKKWSANEVDLLEDTLMEDRLQRDSISWLLPESHSTLGLLWHPSRDYFSFSFKGAREVTPTKRSVLSRAAQLFDPLGWLVPVVVKAKILIQTTWLQGLGWDDPLAEAEARLWQTFQGELPLLSQIRVPRWLQVESPRDGQEIHGFSDVSERTYAAVVYLRTCKKEKRSVSLVAAKTRVAPLKQISLPRLELAGATLLARLVTHVQSTLEMQDVPVYLWSDSTVALGWIQGHPSRWTTYVANRVTEIQQTVPNARWRHLPGRENPADCASRGIHPSELKAHPLWWQSPTWLALPSDSWPSSTLPDDGELPEVRTRTHTVAEMQLEDSSLLTRFSTLNRLVRVTAWCRRWLCAGRPTRRPPRRDPQEGPILSVAEMDDARMTLVRTTRKKELELVQTNQPLVRSHILTKLSPFLDQQGILRVGGRIKHALLAYDERHLMILPSGSHLTELVIGASHQGSLHDGVQATLGLIRQHYWIPRGRNAVKGHIHRCLPCLRWRAEPSQPLMGDLPKQRVTPSRPFWHTGVDYAGPIMLRTTKGRGHKSFKAFVAVFVCMSSRAVHLEAVSDYTSDAFLAALRRFTSRRGLCHTIYSDCGTNFVGADRQLRTLFSASSKDGRQIADDLNSQGIRWRFNPPAAPHFGGLWEAAVKSMKHHFRRVLGDTTLTFEEMATLLAQVEACLNSRPLQALTDDPDDFAALTPGHFLIGSALNAVPEPSLLEVPANRLGRWQLLQQMRDQLWERWSREYLQALNHRPKWWNGSADVEVGRLCLLRNEATPPTRWPLARIVKVHPGEDGRIRVVTVRTAASELVRPVVKLVLLPGANLRELDGADPSPPHGGSPPERWSR